MLAGIFLILAGVSDMLDGSLARANGEASPFGSFIDSVADRFTECLIFTGIAWHLREQPELLLVLAALAGSFLVSYAKARAEALGVELRRRPDGAPGADHPAGGRRPARPAAAGPLGAGRPDAAHGRAARAARPPGAVTAEPLNRPSRGSAGTARAMSAASEPLRILVVEDNSLDRALLAEVLGLRHHQVVLAEDGREALAAAGAGGAFDLIISDMNMPGMNGLELIERLRAVDPVTPIIILTGIQGTRTAVEALKKGANDYLIKDGRPPRRWRSPSRTSWSRSA